MTRHRLLATAALLAALLLAVRIATARDGPPDTLALPAFAAASVPSPSAARDGATAGARTTLAALDAARAAAYADPVRGDPDEWAARTCACFAEDVRRLRALAAAGHRLAGARTRVVEVRVARRTPARWDLVVTDVLAAYAEVDARGRTVGRWPATPPRHWRITLVRVSARWLVGTLARAP